jgi:glutamine synthetase
MRQLLKEDNLFTNISATEILDKTDKFFRYKTKLIPTLATELEFYFIGDAADNKLQSKITATNKELLTICKKEKIGLYPEIIPETGNLQYEVKFKHHDDVLKLAADTEKFKEVVLSTARKNSLRATFAAKPHGNNDMGSGLHIHLSLKDANQSQPVFSKVGDGYNSHMNHVIAGMLSLMPESLCLCVAGEEDMARFTEKISLAADKVRFQSNTTNAPTHICWGYNNRSAALRIPDYHQDYQNIHIEHRLSSASANSYLVISSVLIAAMHGLENKLQPKDRIYGIASNTEYNLDKISNSYQQAKEIFRNSKLRKYYQEILT